MKTQTFGIELEMNHIQRMKAAAVIAAHFGTTPSAPDHTCYHTQTIRMPDGRVWKVMRDSSIPGPDDEKTEVVSPICRWEDIETVQELVRALRKAGAKADPAHCGIHVHIGLGSHTPKTLRNLVNIVNAKEDLLTQSLDIDPERRAQWCKPVDPAFLERLNHRKPATMEAFAKAWYNDTDWHWHAHQHYDPSRYRLLNLHAVWQKGTIEFRAFNSTLHAGEVKSYIQLCMAISHKALTAKSANPTRPETDNPKYTFRCWLLQLGFIGPEFETAREHRQSLVQRHRLALARTPALRPEPLPPAQPPRGVAERHHRVPRLQQHPPRGRGQELHPALHGHQPQSPDREECESDAAGDRQPEVHLPLLAPPAGLHRTGI